MKSLQIVTLLLLLTGQAHALTPWTQLDPVQEVTDRNLKGADFRCRWIWQRNLIGKSHTKEQLYHQYLEIAREYDVLVSVCCYCGMYIRVQELKGGKHGLSHGVCEFDYERLLAEMTDVKSERVGTEVDNDKVMGGA